MALPLCSVTRRVLPCAEHAALQVTPVRRVVHTRPPRPPRDSDSAQPQPTVHDTAVIPEPEHVVAQSPVVVGLHALLLSALVHAVIECGEPKIEGVGLEVLARLSARGSDDGAVLLALQLVSSPVLEGR